MMYWMLMDIVLCVPTCHPDLSAAENIWGDVKQWFARSVTENREQFFVVFKMCGNGIYVQKADETGSGKLNVQCEQQCG